MTAVATVSEPFAFAPMDGASARAIRAWRYPEPYAIYDLDDSEEVIADLLDPRSPHFAVRDAAGQLIGFFAYGTAAEVEGDGEPDLMGPDGTLSVGLGLRPDLTGLGLGPAFVAAGLRFARERFAPRAFRLFVLTFNRRARRVYERAGFEPVRTVRTAPPAGGREFLEMRRPAAEEPHPHR